jgi:uncharacterized protein (DUF305 family)
MTTSSPIRGLTASLLAALALAACRAAPPPTSTPAPQDASPGVSSPVTVAQSDSAAIARARADSARLPYTAADVHFMTMMIGHHAQAIRIAGWAATHDAGPAVRTLAGRILNGQRDEIAIMQNWLRDRLQPVPRVNPADTTVSMPPMAGHAGGHGAAAGGAAGTGHDMATMPGMLTAAQLRELDAARGKEFDRLFLTYMIQHHRGAVGMVKQLFDTQGAGQDLTVFKFASDVNVDQTTEIARMEQMLVDLLFSGSTR